MYKSDPSAEVKMNLIDQAIKDGRTALSEYESKQILASYGIPVTQEALVIKPEDLSEAIYKIGYPLVMKGCAAEIAHKTEKGLIRMDVRSAEEALTAYKEITAAMDGIEKAVLVQQMIKGQRELVVGLTRDPQFGPCVMFGLGGIFTEILEDTSFRVAPIEKRDALEMIQEIKAHKILEAIRGMEPVDKNMLADILIAIGRLGIENEAVKEIDINPLIISRGQPVAVDALVVLA
jgi:acyl-CoA synthetase (NDP forming)